jgi:biotin synthase
VTDVIEPSVAAAPPASLPGATPVEPVADLLERCESAAREGRCPERSDALAVLRLSDADTLAAVAAAGRLRRAAFGNLVKLNFLVNVRSGLCAEDCGYCSQRRGSETGILTYNSVGADVVADAAERAARAGAARVCLVSSGRGPSDRDVEHIAESVMAVRDAHPALEVCACLGILADGQAERLAEAGVDAYNHNLNTSEARYGEICSTHDFSDRVATVESAKAAGLMSCSGVLFGMGEQDGDVVEVATALRALDPDSVPINFLIPVDGTPMQGTWELTPQRCLRILALFRFFFPTTEIRIAGGREVHLRTVQGLGLEVANSIFLGDYLTTEGQAAQADLQMLADWGFEPLELPEHPHAPAPTAAEDGEPPLDAAARPEVVLRRRGVGTELPPNV